LALTHFAKYGGKRFGSHPRHYIAIDGKDDEGRDP
jgi:hypothetical protein